MRPKKSQGRNTHTKGNGLHTSNTSHDTTSLEMTTQRKRDLLASVGFLEQDEELPQVHLTGSFRSNSSQISNHPRFHTDEKEEWYHEKEERRRRKQQMKEVHPVDFDEIEFDCGDDRSSNGYSCGETEDEELLENALEDDYDDDSQCSEREVSSRGGLCCRVTTKLIYIMALVAAFLYIFGDDSTTATVHDDSGLEVQHHEYFSYKGYKDGRIPDDDLAQYGGGLLFQGDDHGVTDDETFVEDGIDVENNLDSNINDINSKESFSKHSTGVPNEDSLWHDLAGYTDLSTPYNPEAGDIAFFWHIPKCGGTTLQDLMMHCIGMVGANEVGGTYASDESLQIIQVENGNRYVNVDVTQPDGIIHAQNMGFVSSGLADVVMSTRFHNVASLFAPRQQDSKIAQGRCFTLLRHPVKRAISMFYYLRDATWEHTYSEIYKSMTIEDYAVSQYTEDNWMVRILTNEMTGILNDGHLDLAKQILESKCLIGIMEEFAASVKRFDRYFGWDQTDFQGGPVQMSDRGVCEARVMSKPDNAHVHPNFDAGSEVWEKLMEKNVLDVGLYEHAVYLFRDVQSKLVVG